MNCHSWILVADLISPWPELDHGQEIGLAVCEFRLILDQQAPPANPLAAPKVQELTLLPAPVALSPDWVGRKTLALHWKELASLANTGVYELSVFYEMPDLSRICVTDQDPLLVLQVLARLPEAEPSEDPSVRAPEFDSMARTMMLHYLHLGFPVVGLTIFLAQTSLVSQTRIVLAYIVNRTRDFGGMGRQNLTL
jgi:hypothetical protein